MADRTVRVALYGTDNGVGKLLDNTAAKGESSAKRIGGAFSKVGNEIGGELGSVIDKIGSGLEKFGEHGMSAAQKLGAAGAATLGVGVALDFIGSKEKQASDQLQQAVANSGHSWDDYRARLESAAKSNERFGDTIPQTDKALQILTQATNDPAKALDRLQLVTNLAAARHMDLDAAATQVSKILGGSGGKTLAQYGITMEKNADGTKDVNLALDQLSAKVQGQAAASVDNFAGHWRVLEARAMDVAGAFAGHVGPVLTAVGPVLMGVGAILETGVIGKTKSAVASLFGFSSAATTSAATVSTAATEEAAAVSASAAEVTGAEAEMAVSATVASAEVSIASAGMAMRVRGSMAAVNASALAMGAVVGAALLVGIAEWQSYANATRQAAQKVQEAVSQVEQNKNLGSSLQDRALAARELGEQLGDVKGKLGDIGDIGYHGGTFWNEMTQVNQQRAAIQTVDSYTESMNKLTDGLVRMGANERALSGEYGVSKQRIEELARANNVDLSGSYRDVQSEMSQALEGEKAAGDAAQALAQRYGLTADQVKSLATAHQVDLTQGLDSVSAAFQSVMQDTTIAGARTVAWSKDLATLADVTTSAKDKVSAFDDVIQLLNGGTVDAQTAQDNLTIAIGNATLKVQGMSEALSGNNTTAAANRQTVQQLIASAQQHAEAIYKQTGSIDAASRAYAADTSAIQGWARQQGVSATQFTGYLGRMGQSAEDFAAGLGANTDAAAHSGRLMGESYLSGFASAMQNGISTSDVQAWYKANAPSNPGMSYVPTQRHASGGKVTGPGSATSDSVPMLASADEWVINAAAAHKIGDAGMAAINSGALPGGGTTIVNITVQPTFGSSIQDAAREIAQALEQWSGRGNNLRVSVS